MKFLRRTQRGDFFEFAHIASKFAKPLIEQYNLLDVDSVIVIQDGRAYVKSKAVLKIVAKLKWQYRWLVIGVIIPPFIRDWMYDVVARNREKWFGRSSDLTCDFLVEAGDAKKDRPQES
ncbi:MAG: DUF393 domain-containing protein [Flavobacteriales bacterium]|nr:DUF393 domain-containing protein [Flavobacteriales bacterium]